MKKYYAVLVFLSFFSVAKSQIVNIPDANFKAFLLNYSPPIDTNADGQIQVSEVQALTALNATGESINNFVGIQAFSNLVSFSCDGIGISTLDVSGMTHLETLDCNGNQLTTLNLSGLPSLKYLNCSFNPDLAAIDVAPLTNLISLNCGLCNLSSLNVTGLVNLQTLDVGNNSLTTLDLSGLTNIKRLNCSNNAITALNVTALTQLTTLKCSYNPIGALAVSNLALLNILQCHGNNLQTLDITPLSQLTDLDCGTNSLTTLDLTHSPQLQHLSCGQNPLGVLDVSQCTGMISLDCFGNNLTSLDVSALTQLEALGCGNNALTTIDLSACPHLRLINLVGNLFTTLDFSHQVGHEQNSFSYILDSCPNLVYINAKNGANSGDIANFSTWESPQIAYICADESSIPFIQSQLQFNELTGVQVNSYCSFVPGGVHNTIQGYVNLDVNNNGCDAADPHFKGIKVSINDGTTTGATFTDASGNYKFFTQAGNFTVTSQLEAPYFTISPASATVNFAENDGSVQNRTFCIAPNGIHKDLEVVLLESQASPGFDANYTLIYKNKGNQTLSGNVNLSFNDAVLDFVSAEPAVSSQSANNLNWSYANLLPFESRTISLTLNVNSPMETPAVNINDVLPFTASIAPVAADETLADNTFNLSQTVVGSFDPNDKTCLEGSQISPAMVGKYLHYMIRFQNSGTAAAQNIVVKDIIDTTKFDMASLQFIAASHPAVTKVTGNKVEFQFEGINLPAEADNEPGSHGFVAFKIKTKPNLVVGNTVSNTANIYFDYNFPIVTNTAATTVAVLGISPNEDLSIGFYPNPVSHNLSITAKEPILSVQLFDLQGRLLQTETGQSETFSLEMGQRSSGIYFARATTATGTKTEKIVKE